MQNLEIPDMPHLCDECQAKLLRSMQPGGLVTRFCGHNHALAIAILGETKIRRWILQGPVTKDQYLEIVAQVSRGSEPELIDDARVH